MASEVTYRERLKDAAWSFIQVLESDSEQDREEPGRGRVRGVPSKEERPGCCRV